MNTLVYVDRELAIAMAVKLVGLELQKGQSDTVQGGFNWLIQANVSRDDHRGIMTDIREYLPEEIIYEIYPVLNKEHKFTNLPDCIEVMARTGADRLLPGRPISVQGTLNFADIENISDYDPFNPPDIQIQTFVFHGQRCFVAQLTGDGFKLPIYFDEGSIAQVGFCHENPVEITGIVRWTPGYSPRGGRTLNLAIRAAALWLR